MERRHFLAAAAAITAVGAAGCGEPDDEGDDDGGGYTLTAPIEGKTGALRTCEMNALLPNSFGCAGRRPSAAAAERVRGRPQRGIR